jgi:hypothetical protein
MHFARERRAVWDYTTPHAQPQARRAARARQAPHDPVPRPPARPLYRGCPPEHMPDTGPAQVEGGPPRDASPLSTEAGAAQDTGSLARILLTCTPPRGNAVTEQPGAPHAGPTYDFGSNGALRIRAEWACGDGSFLRVARWQLRGAARGLYHWARSQGYADPALTAGEWEEPEAWTVGVSLESQDASGARWSVLQRQEATTVDPALLAGRLNGWEAGLIDRATRLARRRAALAPAAGEPEGPAPC